MIDFDKTLNSAISRAFGGKDEIFCLSGVGTAKQIEGVFTLITDHTYGAEGEAEANIVVATLGLQVSQLPRPPVQSDSYRINGRFYVVKDVSFDGLGWAYMDLGLQ